MMRAWPIISTRTRMPRTDVLRIPHSESVQRCLLTHLDHHAVDKPYGTPGASQTTASGARMRRLLEVGRWPAPPQQQRESREMRQRLQIMQRARRPMTAPAVDKRVTTVEATPARIDLRWMCSFARTVFELPCHVSLNTDTDTRHGATSRVVHVLYMYGCAFFTCNLPETKAM